MHAGRHESEGLKEPLNVRIVTAIGLKQEPAGDARILFGELPPELPQMGELSFVILKQFFAHQLFHPVLAAGKLEDRVKRDLLRRRIELHIPLDMKAETPVSGIGAFEGHAHVHQTWFEVTQAGFDGLAQAAMVRRGGEAEGADVWQSEVDD
jgi:hypothetical protein